MATLAYREKSVLITGGCGFLGSHLAESYSRGGHPVTLVDNFATSSKDNKKRLERLAKLRVIEADVTEPWTWAKDLEWPEPLSHVLHFASPASPPHYQRLGLETLWVNSLGLKNALEFADSHKARVVFASTSEIYGDPDISPQPETYWGNVNTVGPRSCYDEAKRFGEALLHTHNLKYGTQHGLVRIFNTYGPNMNPADGRVVINLLVQALKGEALTLYGDGKQTRSFCYVDDLVRGIRAFARLDHEGPVNVGNDREFTILELAQLVQNLFPERKLQITHSALPKDDPKQRRPDLTRARELMGWNPEVKLEQGLIKMLEWLKTCEL